MALLLKTDIDRRVHDHIRGRVARVGGTVNQIVDYRHIRVTDLNVLDGGYGYIKKLRDIRSPRNVLGTIRRYARQEWNHLRRGETVPLDRRTIILDLHEAAGRPDLKHSFDACISSNVVEHSPNPMFFLLNCHFITAVGGYQFHAIPHYRYTFDMYRKPTPFGHFIDDFRKKTPLSDTTHVADYTQSAIVRHGWQKKLHSVYPVAYPFMHHHVYDEFNTRAVIEYMFEGPIVNDIFKTEAYSDNVILYRNTLRPEFVAEFRDIINSYSPAFLT